MKFNVEIIFDILNIEFVKIDNQNIVYIKRYNNI